MSQQLRISRRRFLQTTAMSAATARFGGIVPSKEQSIFSSLEGATLWLNSPHLTTRELLGKVVLLNFWTYSCINWRRQLPYLRAWHERYRKLGLTIIGIHTPEFPFEEFPANVGWAVREMQIPYPVALDNNRSIWAAFNN